MPRPLIKPRTPPQKASEPQTSGTWVSAAAIDDGFALYASGSGTPATKADRATMLAKLRSNAEDAPAELELEAVTFLQRNTPNRNFVRFKPGMLASFAKSFEGQPVLRDHDSRSMMSRGGTIIASKLEYNEDGSKQIRMRLKLVKPWAIESALDGTLDRFSIGWNRTEPVVCSIDGLAFYGTKCSHWPGEKDDATGAMCEAMFTGAEGTEVSGVNVPAVVGTRIESISQLDTVDADQLACILGENATGSGPSEPHEGNVMLKLAQIAAVLGLSAAATEDEVLAAADAHASKLKIAEEANAGTAARLAAIEADSKRRADEEVAATINSGLARLVAAGKMKPGDVAEEAKLRKFAAQSLEVFQYAIDTKLAGAAQTPVGGALPAMTADPHPQAATTLDAYGAENPAFVGFQKSLVALGYSPDDIKGPATVAIERAAEMRAAQGR